MEQVRRHKSREDSEQYGTTRHEADELAAVDAEAQAEEFRHRRAELDETTDNLLDEIDMVLEKNASQFIKHYVQEGGE